MSVSTVLSTERLTKRGKVPANEKLTVEQTNDSYCHNDIRQAGMDRSELHVDHNRFVVRPSPINACLDKGLQVSLREHNRQAEHYPPVAAHPAQPRMDGTAQKKCSDRSEQMTSIRR